MLENVTASAGCRNVLVVTRPLGCVLDLAMVLFKSIVQVDARPVTDVAAQCRADPRGYELCPSLVTRSGTKPATDRAERKNLRAAFMSRVLSIVSMRFPSRSIARYR